MKLQGILSKLIGLSLCMLVLVPGTEVKAIENIPNNSIVNNTNQFYASIHNTATKYLELNHLRSISVYFDQQFITLDAKVTDPNFNVRRNNDTKRSKAILLVGSLLAIATVVPIATWWVFSR